MMNLPKRLAPVAFLVLATLTVSPQKAQAQFTVFDPSTFGETVSIWNEEVSTGVKVAKEVQLATTLLTQTMQIYNLAQTEATYLSKGQILQAVGFAAQHATIPGHPGWDSALMTAGGLANAAVTWQNMTNPSLSLRSRIALINSFASSSLNSLGSCNSAAINNSSSLGQLQRLAISMSPANNTAASLGALGNVNAQQALRYQQCQENLAEQRLKMELIRAHESQDRDQYTLTTNTTIDNYNQAGGGEWDVTPQADLNLTGMH